MSKHPHSIAVSITAVLPDIEEIGSTVPQCDNLLDLSKVLLALPATNLDI